MSTRKDENDFKRSIPYEIVKESYKATNKMFIVCVLLIIALSIETIYIIRLVNDIGTYETTETVDMDTESGTNNYKSIGGDNNGTYESN